METAIFGERVDLSALCLDLALPNLTSLISGCGSQSPCLPDYCVSLNTPQKSQPSYVRPVASHPLFGELQSLLREECQPEVTPVSLLSVGLPEVTAGNQGLPLSVAIGMLQMRFLKAKSTCQEDQRLRELQQAYGLQSAKLESDRYTGLQGARTTPWFYPSINLYYDRSHHSLIERVQRSLALLEQWHSPSPADQEATPSLPATQPPPSLPVTQPPPSRPVTFAPPGALGSPPFFSTPKKPVAKKLVVQKQELSSVALRVMSVWFERNSEHPYPSYETAEVMATAGGISVEQVKKWFANRRAREGRTKTLTEIARRRKRCHEEDSSLLTASKQARNH